MRVNLLTPSESVVKFLFFSCLLVLLYTMLVVFHAILLLCFGEMNNDILGYSRDPLAEPLVHGDRDEAPRRGLEEAEQFMLICSSSRCNPPLSPIFSPHRQHCKQYYRWAKKRGYRLMTIILSNLNRFTNFFTERFLGKFAVKRILKISSRLACVTTLACETLMSAKQAINDKLQDSVAVHLRCGGVVNNQNKVYC